MSDSSLKTIKCPLCEKDYPLNEAMLHSSFACLHCGTLIRASAILQPGYESVRDRQVRARDTRSRDTQPISRGDTQRIERPNLDLDALETDPLARPIPKRKRKGPDPTLAAAVGGVAALAVLSVVIIALSGNTPPTVVAPAGPAPVPVAVPVVAETQAQKDRRFAWENAEQLKASIATQRMVIERLKIALKEATTKHFAQAQRNLEAARAREVQLIAEEAVWRKTYNRLTVEAGL